MNEKRPSAVIDTNLFISGLISPRGAPNLIIKVMRSNRFTIITSPDLITEFEEVLKRPKLAKYGFTQTEIGLVTRYLRRHVIRISVSRSAPVLIRDAKDEKVLLCALAGKADYLVTGDADLLAIRQNVHIVPLKIVTVLDFFTALDFRV